MRKNIDTNRLKQVISEAEEQYRKFIEEEIPEPKRVVEWWDKGARKTNILALYTGGTLGMARKKSDKTGKEVLTPTLSMEELLTKCDGITGFKERFNILGYHVSHIDSTEINTKVWDQLAQLIVNHYEDIDGAVVLHGTDTLAYSSAALAYTLRQLAIPIVFVGAQSIMKRNGTDVVSNVTGALEVAAGEGAEVYTYFNGDIFKGTRVDKRHDDEFDGFHSPIYGNVGVLGGGGSLRFDPRAIKRGRFTKANLIYDPGFTTSAVEIVLSPFSSPSTLSVAAEKDCRAIVLRSYGPGNVPRWYGGVVDYLVQEAEFPVFISSQCAGSGITEDSHYEAGEAVQEAGAIATGDMSSQATVAKVMKLMRNENLSIGQLKKEVIGKQYADEITLSGR